MARIEGTATAITAVRSGAESLRTTIPAWVVKHLELTKDDRLDWWLDRDDNVWMARVIKEPSTQDRKHTTTTKSNSGQVG